jgi:hypothetical protein
VDKTAADKIAALFEEVSETHHRVYRITDGADDDWASWYADWMLNLSELPQILGRRPVRSELVYALVDLGRRYEATAPSEPWPAFYAADLVERFG